MSLKRLERSKSPYVPTSVAPSRTGHSSQQSLGDAGDDLVLPPQHVAAAGAEEAIGRALRIAAKIGEASATRSRSRQAGQIGCAFVSVKMRQVKTSPQVRQRSATCRRSMTRATMSWTLAAAARVQLF